MSEFKRDLYDDCACEGECECEEVYLVELDILGMKGKIFMELAAENAEQAWREAKMDITELKGNDCSVESVSKVLKPEVY